MEEEKRTSRGFRIYHEYEDEYGADVMIVESSAVEPQIWIQVHYSEKDQASRNEKRDSASILFAIEDATDFGLALMKAAQEKRRTG